MFGLGQLVGAPLVGLVNDRYGGGRSVARVLLIVHIFAYSITIIYNEIHAFGVLAFFLTFIFGV
jgi:predicted MFS family arabinose efflux permease